MLEYFGWRSAKAAHAVLLCKMEENKVDWGETTKIDRIRRVHTQRVVNSSNKRLGNKDRPVLCRYYQKRTCGQKGDHKTNGQSYLNVCSVCFPLENPMLTLKKNAKGQKTTRALLKCSAKCGSFWKV